MSLLRSIKILCHYTAKKIRYDRDVQCAQVYRAGLTDGARLNVSEAALLDQHVHTRNSSAHFPQNITLEVRREHQHVRRGAGQRAQRVSVVDTGILINMSKR